MITSYLDEGGAVYVSFQAKKKSYLYPKFTEIFVLALEVHELIQERKKYIIKLFIK